MSGFEKKAESQNPSRRQFIKSVGGSVAAGVGFSMITGCAAGRIYAAKTANGAIAVPASELTGLDAAGSFLTIRSKGFIAPIILRKAGSGAWMALYAACTHKGCEVRPVPSGFDCPCHGSAFAIDGEVLEGPASIALQQFPVTETSSGLSIMVKP